jgi:hypothetical protein
MKGLRLKLGFTAKTNAVVGGAPAITFDPAFNAGFAYSGGDLVATQTASGDQIARAGQARTIGSGSRSFKVTVTTKATSFVDIGLADATVTGANNLGPTSKTIGYLSNGSIMFDGGTIASGLPTFGTADEITCYQIGNLVGFAKNGTPVNSFNTTTGANGTDVSGGATPIVNAHPAASGNGTGNVFTADFASW